jgi:hypothetical protein
MFAIVKWSASYQVLHFNKYFIDEHIKISEIQFGTEWIQVKISLGFEGYFIFGTLCDVIC